MKLDRSTRLALVVFVLALLFAVGIVAATLALPIDRGS